MEPLKTENVYHFYLLPPRRPSLDLPLRALRDKLFDIKMIFAPKFSFPSFNCGTCSQGAATFRRLFEHRDEHRCELPPDRRTSPLLLSLVFLAITRIPLSAGAAWAARQ